MSKIRKSHRKHRKHRTPKKYFIIGGILAVACVLVAWLFYEVSYLKPADLWFETKAADSKLVSLPKDDAPHQSKIEWWYYNGHLTSESGKKFSFHYTIFLISGLMSHTVSHVSLNDHQTGRHYTDQRRFGGKSSVGAENSFGFTLGDWAMKGQNGVDELKIASNDFSFDLNLTNTLPPVFHGNNAVFPLSFLGNSHYYSRTRMPISGTLKIGKRSETVKGMAWFDHQWRDFLTTGLGWDWFSLQLDDGTDIMIYHLHDKTNKSMLSMASFTQNGLTELLSNTDFTLTPGEKWISAATGAAYPIEWNIKIPKKNVDITTRSIVNNSEFDATLTTHDIYWEGAVKVKGSNTGQGFMELSGYARPSKKN
jgi:predicted secreted hydrolase